MRKSVSIPAACRERYVHLEQPAYAAWRQAKIRWSGVSDLVPGYRIANPRPSDVMLIATVGGAGFAVTPTAGHALIPGTLFIGVPGQSVGWGISGPTWKIVWWYLRPDPRWQAWLRPLGLLRSCPHAGLLADLTDDLLLRSDSDAIVARATADLILEHLRALASGSGEAPVGRGFAELWQEVERQPQDDWSVPVLARRLGVSVSTCQRLARAHLGQAPHRALVALRLGRARQLLEQTRYPLATIAELTGYSDAFTFSAAYRAWSGTSPSTARQGV